MDEASAATVERLPPLVEPLVAPEARRARSAFSTAFPAAVVLPPVAAAATAAAAVPADFYLYERKKKNNHHSFKSLGTSNVSVIFLMHHCVTQHKTWS